MRLAGAILVVLAHALASSPASAEAYVPKKDRERQAKSPRHDAVPAPGTKPAKLVNLYNQWTKDWLAVDPAQAPSMDQVDAFLRDHFTNEMTKMDDKLLGVVISAAKEFKADMVTVVSGFRHPKYNLMLRKKGHQVARDSQHTHGNAVDFTIAKVPIAKLHAWAKAQKIGGVGIYLDSGFIHMDTGKIRYWSGE